LRMVQIGETFNRFKRVVREVSKDLGKQIDLNISGADTELDKTLVEKISDPLMHLVRNSMDHGIESTEERIEAGKPENGTVNLSAFHESGNVVIEISDDGRGLSREKIFNKALEKGLIHEGQSLTNGEVYRLIFEPGFSTADSVTNLSGRGVGMDVVRRNIEALRGQVELESEPGKGTKMSIKLPLTLAIIDGFQVRVGDTQYIVPLDMVEECIELNEETSSTSNGGENYINLRDEILPFVYLNEYFGTDKDEHGVNRDNVVVVQFGGKKAGFVVDELLGEHQTVIKPLGKIFQNLQGISGATILGSGEVAMIIDIPELIQRFEKVGIETLANESIH
jgi:two-component system chemotaxis sensor kinase CheA